MANVWTHGIGTVKAGRRRRHRPLLAPLRESVAAMDELLGTRTLDEVSVGD